ncbi:MAG: phosphatidylglycerophosphatase A [Elusimicrobia bacterium]|nr:phosphatidylglycerophosphatase A [Elusimicrobiota bacterium]
MSKEIVTEKEGVSFTSHISYLISHPFLLWIVKAIATGLFLSYIPYRFFRRTFWTGAGLVGTLWGLFLMPYVPQNTLPFIRFWVLSLLGAIVVSGLAEKALGNPDDSRIVIDETVGFWTAMAFLPRHWPVLLLAFVLFRFFDVMKVPGLRFLEKMPLGFGIVLDDVAAGVVANLIIRLGLGVGGWKLV